MANCRATISLTALKPASMVETAKVLYFAVAAPAALAEISSLIR